ncbi:testican-1 isoform X1, partial [Lates japonicus]
MLKSKWCHLRVLPECPGPWTLFFPGESELDTNELSQKMFFFLLPVVALLLSRETAVSGNSNDKWLSTVAQYNKDRSWNRFRDEAEDDYFKSWAPAKSLDQ